MGADLSSSLTGLSLLSGTNAFAIFTPIDYGSATGTVETNAQRKAHAQFTTPATTAPWITPTPAPSVAAVQAMSSIIDTSGSNGLPTDVATDFVVYKALNRLGVLANAAAATTASDAQRKQLEATFASGLAQLQTYMADAPSDKLQLSFGQPSSTAKTIAIPQPPVLPAVAGLGVVSARTDALPGLTGTEKFTIKLSSSTGNDAVTVDLSQAPQPPTLDGVADAINAAISAIPQTDSTGAIVTDSTGAPVPKWNVSFTPTKTGDQWGLTINRTGLEQISIDQVGASDALIVAAGVTAPGTAEAARVTRIDDPTGAMVNSTQGTTAAIDRDATTEAGEVAGTSSGTAPTVTAATSAGGVAVDAQGFSYVVGTTSGDLGGALSNGSSDLYLSKRDSEGNIVWQRDLGAAGSASGTSVQIAADGSVVVAGTVSGTFDGASSDGDMLVARYAANGDEQFATLVRSAGSDTAAALAIGQDGSIYVGGSAAVNGGSAMIAKLSATGVLQQRTAAATGGAAISALAIGGDGQLLALTQQGTDATLLKLDAANPDSVLGSVDLGTASGRALAVAAAGTIAVGGATLAPVAGTQTNAMAGGRDGFVTQITSDLSAMTTTYLASAGDDQVDSVAYMNGELYAGGRTSGTLGTTKQGSVDGFVGRIDPATGAVATVDQFGQAASTTGPVRVAAAAGDDTALAALGLHRGALTADISDKLVTGTSIRAGDSFSISVNGGSAIRITIGADDTLASVAKRLTLLTGGKATVTTPLNDDGRSLQITVKAGSSVELLNGPTGRDALAKLGLAPQTLSVPPINTSADAPKVTPGGRYGLGLSTSLTLATAADAKVAMNAISQAISITQTGYRSLYWDSLKAMLANGGSGGATDTAGVARAQAQAAQYQAALNRLTAGTAGMGTADPVLSLYPISNDSSDNSFF
ncbi:MAG: hypothetical protein ACTHMG_11190 [Sphingomonas sp.]